MLVLLNSTKTMNPAAPRPAGLRGTKPRFNETADGLAARLARLPRARLAALMGLNTDLTDTTRAAYATWGGRAPRAPALIAFTGLVFKYLDATTLSPGQWRSAQSQVRILSGLYGVLRPRDLIASYRLEMGCRFSPPGAKNMVAFWRERVTAELNRGLKRGETVLSLAAQEYLKAVDTSQLKGPVVAPVFRERRADGSLKNAPVHAKMARGALARYTVVSGAATPAALADFHDLGWEAETAPPREGVWLFTRPARD